MLKSTGFQESSAPRMNGWAQWMMLMVLSGEEALYLCRRGFLRESMYIFRFMLHCESKSIYLANIICFSSCTKVFRYCY